MTEYKIYDRCFAHSPSTTAGIPSKYIKWRRDGPDTPTTFITDDYLNEYNYDLIERINSKKKVAWLIEPIGINPRIYKWISECWRYFDKVLVHHRRFITIDKRFLYYSVGGCWIPDNYKCLYPKTENICIIASGKGITSQHHLRNSAAIIAQRHGIRVFGGMAGNYTPNKHDILSRFRYAIEVENTIEDGYFTEKLIDCFATYTIPIYCGPRDIGTYFNPRGIITFSTIDELISIIKDLPQVDMSIIKENFELAKKYNVAEDWIHENLITTGII